MKEKLHERVFSAFSGRFGNRPSQGCRISSFVETRLEHQTNFLIYCSSGGIWSTVMRAANMEIKNAAYLLKNTQYQQAL
jgi:hypothetical protein